VAWPLLENMVPVGGVRLFRSANNIFPEVHEGYKCRAGINGVG
jgi:hypothetical protein